MSFESVTADFLIEEDDQTRLNRVGVIPFSFDDNNDEVWLMGSLISGRLSDFGGVCSYEDEGILPYVCASRHIDLESNGLLTSAFLDSFQEAINDLDEGKISPRFITWRYETKPRKDILPAIDYLIFFQVDYDIYRDIGDLFNGNEENTSLSWYSRKDLSQTKNIKDFNSSIQKFIRRFDF